MKWLEIIELRSAESNQEILKSKIETLVKEVQKEEAEQGVQTFSHGTISSDFSIHLFHDSRIVPAAGSDLGLHIASSLKEYGLVNHTIWIEKQRDSLTK